MLTKTTTPGTEEGIDLDKPILTQSAFEEIAASWDGCEGEGIKDIGAALRQDFERLAQPQSCQIGPEGERLITQDWMAYCTVLRQAGKEPTDAQGDAFEFAWNAASIALARRAAPMAHPIGQADPMPGASGFTMACFKASDVPVGTKLYLAPSSTDSAQAAVEEVRDAARWRALIGSSRIRPLGSAGLNEPMPNDYAHMGLEIWTTGDWSDCSPELAKRLAYEQKVGVEWLTKYADIAIRAQSTAAQAATEGDKS
jgi:hypothetical protein